MPSDYRPFFVVIMTGFAVALVLAIVGLAEPAWLPGTDTNAAIEQSRSVAVSLSEWKIGSATGDAIGPLKAGDRTFDVHNNGQTQHEFVLVRSDADPGSFPVQDDLKFNEEAAGFSPGETGNIDPGQAKTVTLQLDAGSYVFFCNIPGHYKQGMYGRPVVQ